MNFNNLSNLKPASMYYIIVYTEDSTSVTQKIIKI
jgi:hypothetical protein